MRRPAFPWPARRLVASCASAVFSCTAVADSDAAADGGTKTVRHCGQRTFFPGGASSIFNCLRHSGQAITMCDIQRLLHRVGVELIRSPKSRVGIAPNEVESPRLVAGVSLVKRSAARLACHIRVPVRLPMDLILLVAAATVGCSFFWRFETSQAPSINSIARSHIPQAHPRISYDLFLLEPRGVRCPRNRGGQGYQPATGIWEWGIELRPLCSPRWRAGSIWPRCRKVNLLCGY